MTPADYKHVKFADPTAQKNFEALVGLAGLCVICGTILSFRFTESLPLPVKPAAPMVIYVPSTPPEPVDYGPRTIPETSPTAEEFLSMPGYAPEQKTKRAKKNKTALSTYKTPASRVSTSGYMMRDSRPVTKQQESKPEKFTESKPLTGLKGPKVNGASAGR
jgi:hypothetical protein